MSFSGLAANRYIGNSPQYGFFTKQVLTPDSVALVFDLDFIVVSSSSILVFLDGVVQEPEVDYTIITSGTQISFTVAPTSGLTLYIQYLGQLLMLPTAASYVAGSINPIDINPSYSKSLFRITNIGASTNVKVQFVYYLNTLAGAVTLTLPNNPVFGDKIIFVDTYRSFSTNAMTINRNGKNINSVGSNYVARIAGSRITIEFINNTIGWRLTLDMDHNQKPQDAKLFFLGS